MNVTVPWQTLIVTFGSGYAVGGLLADYPVLHNLLALAIIGLGAFLLKRAGKLDSEGQGR